MQAWNDKRKRGEEKRTRARKVKRKGGRGKGAALSQGRLRPFLGSAVKPTCLWTQKEV